MHAQTLTYHAEGGNIMAAVISMSLFKIIKPSRVFSTQEANVCQTVASSAGAIVVRR